MKVRVDDIPENGLWFSFSGQEDVLSEALRTMPLVKGIKASPFIHGAVDLLRTDDGIVVRGTIRATLTLQCSRCLAEFDLDQDLALDLLIRGEESETDMRRNEDDEPNEIFISGQEIDVGEIVVQELFLEAPMKPLCRQECPGLCPRCGALIGSCNCPQATDESVDPRWNKLAGLAKK